jgi:LCP family protein required for cell wall assembly
VKNRFGFLQHWMIYLVAGLSLFGCTVSPAAGAGAALLPLVQTQQPTYILEVPGATATATPFQPIPPTPVLVAADLQLPTEQEFAATATPTLIPPDDTPEQEQAISQPFGQINILLLGADARPWSSNFRTDTIILLTLNSELGRVNLTSFPRDLYITVPGYGLQRINTAYTYGKIPLLYKTFEFNFGVRPDHYVLINFKAFKQIIDSLDGLDVNVGQSLSDYRAGYWVTIPSGVVHMDADTVLWYVRSRKTTNDFARNRRQQEVLQALFDKFLSLNALRRVPELYDLYDDNVTTDVNLMDLLTWLPLAARVAETRDINHYYINSNRVYDWITPGGAMVLLPDKAAVMQIIKKSQNLR